MSNIFDLQWVCQDLTVWKVEEDLYGKTHVPFFSPGPQKLHLMVLWTNEDLAHSQDISLGGDGVHSHATQAVLLLDLQLFFRRPAAPPSLASGVYCPPSVWKIQ